MPATSIRSKLARASLVVLVPTFLGVTAAVVGLNVWLNQRNQRESVARIEADLVAKGRVVTSNSAQALVGMAEGNAFLQIQALIAGTVKEDPDVVSGIFMMADSSLPWAVAREGGDTLGWLAKADTLRDTGLTWAATRRVLAHRRVERDGEVLLEFAAPVELGGGAPLGWVRYVLDTRSMRESIRTQAEASRAGLLQVVALLMVLGIGALASSLWRFRREAAKLSRPIQDLAHAASIIGNGDYNRAVDTESDDEIGELAVVLDAMRKTVQRHTEHLEELVEAKMRQVRDILDNVEQGIFVVDLDGNISPEHSRAAPAILGLERLVSLEEAFHLTPSQFDDMKVWLNLVRARGRVVRWEKLVRLAPLHELDIPGADGEFRFVRLRYQKMFDARGSVDKVMVLATDETEARRIERVVAEEKERHENEVKTILGLVNNLPEALHDFFRDAERRLGDLRAMLGSMHRRSVLARENFPEGPSFHPAADEIGHLARDLHTLKGNAGTYGFELLSRLAHRSEDLLEELKEPISVRTSNTLQTMLGLLDQMDDTFRQILLLERRLAGAGLDGDVFVQVSERKLDHLSRLAKAIDLGGSSVVGDPEALDPLIRACRTLRNMPLTRLSDKYASLVQRLAGKLDKQIQFHCVPATLELDPRFFGPVDEAIVHLLRNAVDHGIENPSQRVAQGKPEAGRVVLEVSIGDDQVAILVGDDGTGIDRRKVAEKVVEEGILTRSQVDALGEDEVTDLVMEAGVSTASTVSEISGRGIGMHAVRECVERLGGRVTLTTRLGEGTQVLMQLPGRFAAAV